ncbi:2-hydroxyacyl-CoA lyase 1-like protein [Aphelenchoides avenae]|nr:2-hydroxyacyl-CoA lyase 1-like protein [Aphelenchus avenae]
MRSVNGAAVIARTLKHQGVKYIFGVAGHPIVEVGVAAQAHGINYVGCRNEQSACYAAQAMGYLTQRPSVCLVVSGVGLLHSIGGLANATVNSWPLVCIAGSAEVDHETRGGFQEYPQLDAARPHCKHVSRPASVAAIPHHIEKAIRTSMYGRPGATYIDIPSTLVLGTASEEEIRDAPAVPLPPPVSVPDESSLRTAAELLQGAKRPLVIIGKGTRVNRNIMCKFNCVGSAWSTQGPGQLSELISEIGVPFLTTPGGKGIVSDDHPLNVASARTQALKEADVVLVAGARLNWILHFGRPPRFARGVKFIHIDSQPEEFHQNVPTAVPLLGDVGETVAALREQIGLWRFDANSNWTQSLQKKCNENRKEVEKMALDSTVPLNYYAAYSPVREFIDENDVLVISEGANTMDIGRTMMPNRLPRRRLDAGTLGTMGVGLGYTLAAGFYCREHSPNTVVLAVLGDSAFGFSAMELETMARYKLPVIIVIFNNSGIYRGMVDEDFNATAGRPDKMPVLALLPDVQYDKMAEALGGHGVTCRTKEEIKTALESAKKRRDGPTVINVLMARDSMKKTQQHTFMTLPKA